METMTETEKCLASVPKGTSTYAMRNSYRRCNNTAGESGYCHVHASKAVTAEQSEAFAALRDAILGS